MRKLTLVLVLLFIIGMQVVNAQRTISGTVTSSENGTPIPGATVLVKNTTIGTTTNVDGKFELSVPQDAKIIVISYVGMASKEIELGALKTFAISLEPDIMDIEGVVVTALGMTREKKSLGYSVQDIKGEDLEAAKETNIVNSLSGKVAGVQVINASGAVGASSRITIRGNSSFGENQPLFVVDGVPVSNYSTAVDQYGGIDFGNAAMDIDPANIESMSVLKGANAAALYGSRAANGVILITTKSAKKGASKGIGVTFTTAYEINQVSYLPLYQDKYGQGYAGDETHYFDATGMKASDDMKAYETWCLENSFSYYDGNWGGVNDGMDESWGPRLDAGLMIPQFDSPYVNAEDPTQGHVATPWVSQPDNVKDFFQNGATWDNNLSLVGGTDKTAARLSLSSQNITGAIPNTDLKKYSVNFNGSMELSKRLTANATITYVQNQSDNLPGNGYDENNIMQSLGSWWGRQINMQNLKDHWQDFDGFGQPYNWNSSYHNNPYWTTGYNTTSRTRNRTFGNINLTYKITDWLSVMGRIGQDAYNEYRKHLTYDLSIESSSGGYFWQNQRFENETNADIIFTADKDLSEDFGLKATLGANYMNYKYKNMSEQANELTVPNLFTIGNTKGNPTVSMYDEEKESNSIYGSLGISFRRMLYLDITARNDWYSTLPKDSWSYFYPSFSLSWVFTETFDISPNILTFGKLRGGWAQVGNSTGPYQITPTFSSDADPYNGVACFFYTRTIPPLNLMPEKTNSTEFGLDLKFLNNRIGVDYTYYMKSTMNQILAVNISRATGFNNMRLNAGQIDNWGHELMVTGVILKSTEGLNWEMTLNWSKNNNEVVELYEDPVTHQKLLAYQISASWQTVTIEARPGEPWGVIRGKGFVRDETTGKIIVGANGLPKKSALPVNIGNIEPDWVGGLRNTFRWKDLSFSFLLDFRKGGDIFSVTDWFGAYSGVTKESAEDIEGDLVKPAGDGAEIRRDGVIVDGVQIDENGKAVENTTVVGAQDFYENYWGLHEISIIDGSFLKLREVIIDYHLPDSWMTKTGFIKSADISLYGRNLALLARSKSNDVRIDPETGFGTSNNGVGLEQYQLPPTRSMGIKLRLTF
ncbi:MAG: SusC/RagA family TonB-linked outer membrane protein [Bacteroidetes bacterium]|nr:SusC/RagA family TonB-linked outer membrane protein [Bacteroidota bacterium]